MRHTIELHDTRNQPIKAELDIRTDTVELHLPRHRLSSTDRDFFTSWLHDPYGTFAFDETTWEDTRPITLTIGEFTAQLSDEILNLILDDLRGAA